MYIYIRIYIYILLCLACVPCAVFANLIKAVVETVIRLHNTCNEERGVPCMLTHDSFPVLWQLEKLAGIGSHGQEKSHCKRDLLALLRGNTFPLYWARLSLRHGPRLSATAFVRQCFLLPHLLMVHLYQEYGDAWQRLVCPSTEILESFWSSQAATHPGLHSHPLRRRRNWWRRAIPLCPHGDAVPVVATSQAWSKSLLVLSWCSLVGAGNTLQSQFVIYLIYAKLLTNRSRKSLWKLLAWSFRILWNGVHPDRNVNNVPYAAGTEEHRLANTSLFGDSDLFCVTWGMQGDLDYYDKDTPKHAYFMEALYRKTYSIYHGNIPAEFDYSIISTSYRHIGLMDI